MGKANKAFGIKDKKLIERLVSSIKKKNTSIKVLNILLKNMMKFFEVIFNKNIITYHIRPKYSNSFQIRPSIKKSSKSAIMIQGPIDHTNNFTLETIKIYKNLFTDMPLILSTWEDEEEDTIATIQDLGVEVIQSSKPESSLLGDSAWKNVDLQLISAKAGIRAALNHDVEYCLKTRTDQRFYRSDLINYFLNLIELFPINDDSIQNQRIISSSFATAKYRVYGLTDMIMFGDINDLKNYWDVENYSKGIVKFIVDDSQYIPPIIAGTLVGAEVYLMSSYLKRIGVNLEWTLEHYWEMLRKHFLVCDSSSLDMYWNKYNKESEYQYARTYEQKTHRLIDFADWLQIYKNNNNSWDEIRNQELWERSDDGKLLRLII